MAYRNSADIAFLLINGYEVRGTRTQIDDNLEAILERTDGLGDLYEEQSFTGVRRAEITQQGFFDDAVGSIHDILSTGPGISRILCYGDAGTATGAHFLGYEGAMQVNYERAFARGELEKANARYVINGTVDNGKIIESYRAFTAVGGQTRELDLGATQVPSNNVAVGYLQYNASAGEANIRIQHSSNAVAWATFMTFTKTASGFGAERITATGLDRYVRVNVATASATGDITALNAFIGIVQQSAS